MTLKQTYGILCLAALAVGGCKSTYDTKRVSAGDVQREGTIVWARPKQDKPLESLRRRMEVTYENAAPNAAGFLEVRVGCRNKSGSPLVIYLKTAFYSEPFAAPGTQTSAPIYQTSWERMSLIRGATDEYKVTCPKATGKFYQVTISEDLY